VVAAGAALGLYHLSAKPSVINTAQSRAMRSVIQEYADEHAGVLFSGWGYLDASLKPRIFCNAAILEIDADGPKWRVGMMLNCGEFAREGHQLIEGAAGEPGIADTATLATHGDAYEVLAVQVGPPAWDKAWVDANFSSSVAGWILNGGTSPPTAPDPVDQAWKAFGLRPGTPAIEQT
jgi:hypothetical protein